MMQSIFVLFFPKVKKELTVCSVYNILAYVCCLSASLPEMAEKWHFLQIDTNSA